MLERLITSFQNILKIPELRSRVLFMLAMLAVYRVGAHIPTPGIDGDALSAFLLGRGGALLGFLDIFSGGALSRLTIFALGIMPYISASIIIQLLTVVIPHLSKLAKEGERGRKTIIQYTRYGTIGIALVQGFGISLGLEGMNQGQFVMEPGWPFRFMTVITLTAGTAFLMWLGEQITERGVGNGISLIIFAGIVAQLPSAVVQTFEMYRVGELSLLFLLLLGIVMVGVVTAIVFLESGRRKVPVQYAKRIVGRRVYGGQSTHIPLKINTAGVIPPIFASSIIAFPATMTSFIQVPWVQALGGAIGSRVVHLYVVICQHDYFLLFFLYGGCVESGRYVGQHEEAWRFYSRYQAGPANGGLYLQGAHSHHVCRRAVLGRGLRDSGIIDLPVECALLFWRDLVAHRRWCGVGYRAAD